MKKVFQFFTIISLITLGFGQIEDGCDLPDFNLYLTDKKLLKRLISIISRFF